jgi:undecaprenyl diphosphate synthase
LTESKRTPQHIAIIMDGNGRWARQRGLPRVVGHERGASSVRAIVDACCDIQIPFLTLFAFSSENWGRPKREVDALMSLLASFLKKELPRLHARKVRLRAIGDLERLPPKVSKILHQCMADTCNHSALTLTLALSYGSRDEIVRAVQQAATLARDGQLDPQTLTAEGFSRLLDTREFPDPDLLIRTSGESRLSNFLLWQLAYTEIYITDTLWPDFGCEQLQLALEDFARRDRRFGLAGEE